MIYLDNAATTVNKPECVIHAVMQAMSHMGNAGRGAHDASLDASRMIFETRMKLAELFHADGPEQVAFTANSTEALNMAIQGIISPGDHVITTQLEHNSVLRPLYHAQQQGAELTILEADALGNIDYGELEAAVKSNTRAVVCTHASNLTGNMIDLKRVGAVCKDRGILLIVDASQSAGVYPVDMQAMHIDVLCFTGHKGLMGPQGTGGICVRKGLFIRPLLMGGSGVHSYLRSHPSEMPTALEAGTLNGHGIAGLHAALSYLEEMEMERLCRQEMGLMWLFYDGMVSLPGVTVYGDFSSRTMNRAPIVTLNIGNYDSGEVSDELYVRYGISTRAGAHCAPLMHQALGTVDQGAVRFSFSHRNTEDEVLEAVRAVRELAEEG